ncbi:MAG: polysaccharide biosynthesis C-terminal domain-containing protein [Flavobacteriales bacterium]
MEQIKEFIQDFLSRSGAKVFNSMILSKVIGFMVSVAMARILTKESYGDFTYAFTAVSFLIPFLGFGAYQSLVYFGARFEKENEKRMLFQYSFSRGIMFSAVLSVLLIVFSTFITQNRPNSHFLLIVLSLHILTFTLVEFVRNYTRLINRNDIYAESGNCYSLLLLALAITGALLFGARGYAWALVIVPLAIGVYYLKKLNISSLNLKTSSFKVPKKFWRYGLFVSLGAVASQMMYIVDIMTIGNTLNAEHLLKVPEDFKLASYTSEQIAIYKVCSIIPIASFILPLSIVTTDFVKVSENARNKSYLNRYSFTIMKILFPIGVLVALALHFGSDLILKVFGPNYQGHTELFSVFSLAVIGAFTFRVPFGNLLSAVGKANWNAYISFGVLALNVVLNYYLVKSIGILGAAWATTILIWISGLINFACWRWYISKIN